MDSYPIDLPVKDLLPIFYRKYNLGTNGGQSSSRVKLELGKYLFFYIPNWKERRRAVLFHDVHHIVTTYPSTILGETEIAAWEIASSCKDYTAAWLLNLPGLFLGLFVNFKSMFRAFVRGRRSLNLYYRLVPENELLEMSVKEIQAKIEIPSMDREFAITRNDMFSFVYYLFLASLLNMIIVLFIPALIIFNIYCYLNAE